MRRSFFKVERIRRSRSVPTHRIVRSIRRVALLFVMRSLAARAEEPLPLLTYCAPPVVPSCIDDLKPHPGRLAACAPLADAYVATVFTYRACLNRETERAVREANTVIAKVRCAQKRGPCAITAESRERP